MPGGVPITMRGQLVGGVAVSGAENMDQEIAEKGADLENK